MDWKITVRVKLNSKTEAIERCEDGSYLVRINAPPKEGRANKRIIELLSKHLKKPKSKIELVSGHRGKKKVFLIRE